MSATKKRKAGADADKDQKTCKDKGCTNVGHVGCVGKGYCAVHCPTPDKCTLKSHNTKKPKASASASAAVAAASASSSAAAVPVVPVAYEDVKLEYLGATDLKDTKVEELDAKCLDKFVKVGQMAEGRPAMLDHGTLVAGENAFYFLVRQEMIYLIRLLRSAKQATCKPEVPVGTRDLQMHTGIGRVLGGAFGVGKSTTIHTVVHVARQVGYLVLYIPNAPALVDGAETINQKARDLLNRHLNSHRNELKTLQQKMPREAKYGKTLETLLDVGRADTGRKHGEALHVLGEYLLELNEVQDMPVLLAVDGWNSLLQPGKLKDPDTNEMTENVAVGKNPIATMLSNFNSFGKLTYGTVLFGVSSSFVSFGHFNSGNAKYQRSVQPISLKETQLMVKLFQDKKLLTPDPGAALKLDAAVPVLRRETGGLGRELIAFCRDAAIPWSVGANGAPDDAMLKAYRKASRGTWSDKVRKFLKRQKESDVDAFKVSCTVIGQLFVNERIVSDPPESWRSSGFFIDTPGGWVPSCPTVRASILALSEDAAHDVFKEIIRTLMGLGDELQWKALEMLVQKPFVPSGGNIALPLVKMDGTDTKHTLPLQFTRVIQFDRDNVDRYLTRTDVDYKLGKGDFVISYPNFPAIDLFGCTRDGTAVFIQVSLSSYKAKRSQEKDLRALFNPRGELRGHSVYDFFRLAINDSAILPARAATAADTTLCATAKYVFVTTTKAQGVSAATAGDAHLCNYDLLKTFHGELAALFPAKD